MIGQLLKSLREQMTLRVALGLGVLLFIVCYFVFDTFSRWNAQLINTVADQKLQISQMQAMADAPAQKSVNARMAATLESLSSRLLTEDTTGLNSASFQQEVRQTLQGCGLQNVSVQIALSEDTEFGGLVVYESSVRARDVQARLATCLNDLSNMSVSGIVSYLNWNATGSVQMNILGFSEE